MMWKTLFRSHCLLFTTNVTPSTPGQPLGAWVHAIAKYKLVDFLRGRGIRESLNESLDDVGELPSDSNVEAAEARRDIMKLLDRLPEKQRMPIVSHQA
jgi:RNA polymerase sigma-70 factor (ECF subfamily)